MYSPTTTLGKLLRATGNPASLALFRNTTGRPCPTCGAVLPYFTARDDDIGPPHRHAYIVFDAAAGSAKLVPLPEVTGVEADHALFMHKSTVPF